MAYELFKTIHVISSTVLFGTGIGIAFFFLMGTRSGDPAAAYFAARTTALADMIFTLTAGVVQPLSGFALIHLAGHDPFAPWLVATRVFAARGNVEGCKVSTSARARMTRATCARVV